MIELELKIILSKESFTNLDEPEEPDVGKIKNNFYEEKYFFYFSSIIQKFFSFIYFFFKKNLDEIFLFKNI